MKSTAGSMLKLLKPKEYRISGEKLTCLSEFLNPTPKSKVKSLMAGHKVGVLVVLIANLKFGPPNI